MTTTHLDLYALLHETHPEPIRRADRTNRPTAGYDDPDSPEGQDVELDRYDGDGELRGTETLTELDRALL